MIDQCEHTCEHRLVKWLAYKNGLYVLVCVACNKLLGPETYSPATTQPFKRDTTIGDNHDD